MKDQIIRKTVVSFVLAVILAFLETHLAAEPGR
jgi:hypothetical protein